MHKISVTTILLLLIAHTALAAMHTRDLDYRHGNTLLQGFLAYDDSIQGKRPGVLIVHEWYGINDYAKGRARQLADLGYVVFALDMYGKGIRPKNNDEAGKEAGIYRKDRHLMRERASAGLEVLKSQPQVDPKRIAAIGYCFGGGTVLELARSGADIKGVVSFHGNLDTPDPNDAANIRAKILVLTGADDPGVPDTQVLGFEKEMRAAGVDWSLVRYGNAVHSFTNPASGDDPSKGAAYNANADKRSWKAMQDFFLEIF